MTSEEEGEAEAAGMEEAGLRLLPLLLLSPRLEDGEDWGGAEEEEDEEEVGGRGGG